MKPTKGQLVFSGFNYGILTVISIAILYPLLYCVSASFSGVDAFIQGRVVLWPVDFTLDAYRYVLKDSSIWMAYGNTIYYTAIGTLVSVALTVLGAYPLSKKRLRGNRTMNFLLSLTLWFNAGIIPFYLNMNSLHLVNTRISIIIGFACTTFNVILMRTFFEGIPDALEEAAKIDGANDFRVLTQIILPISIPSIATIGLFYAVSRWNGYFWAMILLKDEAKIPLQVLLKKLIVTLNGVEAASQSQDVFINYTKETVVYATIVISVIPMLVAYPFIQKYFVKGIMVGSIKG